MKHPLASALIAGACLKFGPSASLIADQNLLLFIIASAVTQWPITLWLHEVKCPLTHDDAGKPP